MIHKVPPHMVQDLWGALSKYVDGVAEYHPFMETEDFLVVVLSGYGTLFISTDGKGIDGFAIMEIVEYPRRRVANCLACGGRDGFLGVAVTDLLAALKVWGREQNADTFAMNGRPGWLKALRLEKGESTQFITWWTEITDVKGRRYQTDHGNVQPNGHHEPLGSSGTLPQ